MDKNTAEVLKQIADKIDVPVQQLWAGLVAYAPFTYYQWIAGVAIGLFIAMLCGLLLAYVIKKEETEGFIPALFMLVVVLALTGSWFISGLPDAMAAKNAPEAWAAQQIIKKFGR